MTDATLFPDLSSEWVRALGETLATGGVVTPRGQRTFEVAQRTLRVDLRRPVLMVPERKLNYRFMAAEAYWILSGDDRVATIAPYNKRIAEFSDDGERFFGAYGPKIMDQLPYVVRKLREDGATRQAWLTLWRENPPVTKDYPCTLAMGFMLRRHSLNMHVFMRSSDLWLGIPYDVFTFSMVAHQVAARLNDSGCAVVPGRLYLTAASSHLYERDWAPARDFLDRSAPLKPQAFTPPQLYNDEPTLMRTLAELRETKPGDERRWWERFDG